MIRDGLIAVLLGLLLGTIITCASTARVEEELDPLTEGTLEEQFEEVLERLNHWCPPRSDYVIRLSAFPDKTHEAFLGLATRHPITKVWTVQVCSRHEFTTVRDTLIHEWGHMLRNHAGCIYQTSHDSYWGVAYAEAYQAAMRKIPEEKP